MKYRKLTVLFLIAVLLCGCGKTEKAENPYRIKTQILETYRQDKTKTIRTEYIYDENGWLTKLQTFDEEELWYTRSFTLDEHGNDHGSEVVYADGSRNEERGLTFDDQGRMLTSESYQNEEVTATTEYGYGEDGQIIKLYINRIGALNGQDLNSFVDSTYDQKGNLIRQDIRWEPSGTKEHTLYIYEKDKLLRTETYTFEELNYYTDYTYDETGRIQTAMEFQADGTPQTKHVTTLDEYGNALEVVAYAYASELARFGETDEEPDSRTVNIYELKEETP